MSCGVATHPEFETVDDLVHQADLALYRSKALGRNRVSGRVELAAAQPAPTGRRAGRTGGQERVRQLAVALARTLGYRGDDLEAIEVGALLHDIGKIGVPERILNKPGPLTDEEWEEMKQHPVTSDHILSGIEMHPFVRQIVRSSHERIDGKGYPDGLEGEDIPLPARIVLVADAFDALASHCPHRRPAGGGGDGGAPRARRHPVLPERAGRARARVA